MNDTFNLYDVSIVDQAEKQQMQFRKKKYENEQSKSFKEELKTNANFYDVDFDVSTLEMLKPSDDVYQYLLGQNKNGSNSKDVIQIYRMDSLLNQCSPELLAFHLKRYRNEIENVVASYEGFKDKINISSIYSICDIKCFHICFELDIITSQYLVKSSYVFQRKQNEIRIGLLRELENANFPIFNYANLFQTLMGGLIEVQTLIGHWARLNLSQEMEKCIVEGYNKKFENSYSVVYLAIRCYCFFIEHFNRVPGLMYKFRPQALKENSKLCLFTKFTNVVDYQMPETKVYMSTFKSLDPEIKEFWGQFKE